jgi:PTS system beta-glucosides-specific IIC component
MADNRQIATDVLATVGGSQNVAQVTHCMTRLRLNLKDESLADDEKIKKIDGVLGVVHSGGQTQVIIGQNVPKVYTEFCELSGVQASAKPIDENLDNNLDKKKITPKTVGSNVLNYLAGSLTPLIPILIGAAMFKTVLSIFGPDLLGCFSEESDFYILFNMVYNAGFYFLPIYIGYTAAVKIGASPVLGLFMGGILIVPDFVELAASGSSFSVYGIPCMVNDYSQSVLPIILSVWVLKYVEKFFRKYIPDALSTIFVPFLTMAVMLPVSLCVLAPAGAFIGQYISSALVAFGNVGGFVGVAVIAALWEFLVMSGMHVVMVVTVINIYATTGSESVIWPAALCATAAASGMALGAFFRLKNKKDKSLSLGYVISGLIGGVTEPSLYGIGFKYKKPFIGMMIGAAIGGVYAGITKTCIYSLGATNFLMVLCYSGGAMSNLINGAISCVIAFVGSAVATFIIGVGAQE